MSASSRLHPVFATLVILILTSCSNVQEIESSSPQQLSEKAKVIYDDSNSVITAVHGPPISVRAGFGEFSKGLLLGGGASFGNWAQLEAARNIAGAWDYRVVASIQYTNLGGVYRRYDKAGVEGVPPLTLVTLDMDKQFTINSINMTETLSVALQETFLRERRNSGFILVIADNSGNREEFAVPASYVAGFLMAVEK